MNACFQMSTLWASTAISTSSASTSNSPPWILCHQAWSLYKLQQDRFWNMFYTFIRHKWGQVTLSLAVSSADRSLLHDLLLCLLEHPLFQEQHLQEDHDALWCVSWERWKQVHMDWALGYTQVGKYLLKYFFAHPFRFCWVGWWFSESTTKYRPKS